MMSIKRAGTELAVFKGISFLLRFCMLLGALLLAMQSASAATLSGTVYGNGTPMPNAMVRLFVVSDSSVAGQTTTDGGGHYTINVTNGTYNLLVVPAEGATGYVNSPVNGIVVAGADLTQNVILITGASAVSGVVRLPDGSPLKGVEVTLQSQSGGTQYGQIITGSDGAYAFAVPPGTYKFMLYGYLGNGMTFPGAPRIFHIYDAFPNTTVEGVTAKDLTLPFAYLSGGTTDSNGASIGNVELQETGFVGTKADGSTYYSFHDYRQLVSDADGNYSMALFDGLTHRITAIPPAGSGLAQTIFDGVALSGDTARDFALPTALMLSGVVKLPDGTPVAGVQVTLVDQATGNLQYGQVTTGIDGAYSFAIGPGTYKFKLQGWNGWGMHFPGAPRFFQMSGMFPNTVVSENMTKDLPLPFVWLSGRTIDGNGTPVGGVELQTPLSVGPAPGGFYYSIYHNEGYTKSDADGQYSMAVLDGFNYRITAIPPAGSGLAQTVFPDVAVAGNMTRDFALVAEVLLTGVVKLPDGTPVQGVRITLVEEGTNAQFGQTITGSDGAYAFSIRPGTYAYNLKGSTDWGMNFPGHPREFQISFGWRHMVVSGSMTRDLTLPFAWLSGTTTDSNGAPIGGVELQTGGTLGITPEQAVYDIYHDSGSAKSDGNGNYSAALFDGYSYDFSILPKAGSGFDTSMVHGLAVSGPTAAGIVLQIPDTTAPRILSGPLATQVGTTTATIVWQTDEPATGGVAWGSGSVNETGYQTQHALTLSGLTASTTYTATASATDHAGNGPTTGSVSFTTLSQADTTPPLIIAGPTVSALTHQSAVIEWETNEPASTQITGDRTATVAGLRTHHRVALTGLSAQTAYALNVNSTDAAGNGPTVRSLGFTTLGTADTTPPVITKGPWSADITSNAATILWETDEPANSGVSYNDGTAYSVLNDDALTRQHSVRMVGLAAATLYNVIVSSKDVQGNGPTLSPVFGVTTLSAGDTEPPVFVEPPSTCNINHQLIHLCFRTDEPASVIVRYGLAADALNKTEARAQLIQQHSVPINGLQSGTTYYFQVLVRDAAGNERAGAVFSAATTASGAQTAPQFVRAPAATYQGNDRVVIEWETDRPCNGVVEYGVGSFGLQVSDGTFKTVHKLVVPNLAPGTSYQFRVRVTDVEGDSAVDAP